MFIYQNALALLNQEAQELNYPTELSHCLERLNYPRRGWLLRHVQEQGLVESAQQHVAKLVQAGQAINCSHWGIDPITLRKQLLIHELPEILGTDWVPGEISLEEKAILEEENLQKLLPPQFPQRAEIIQTWHDYEKQGLAYYLDKMDASITADYYALTNPAYNPVAEEFYTYASSKVTDSRLRAILKQVHSQAENDPFNDSPHRLTKETIFPYYFDLLRHC